MSDASRESVPAVVGPVLGIETSCDETAAAVVAGDELLSSVVFSQTEHSLYGGVVPELASRNHVRKIVPVIQQALDESGLAVGDLAGIAPTRGPGLVGCLLVGISAAKGLAMAAGIDLVGVHHIEGHLFAGQLACPELRTPFLTLVASGGHTDLVRVGPWGHYTIRGRTRDDAAGEAFDKVAKMLGLGYPGGAVIDRMAAEGDPQKIKFKRTYLDKAGFDFSFSGIKTAVRRYIQTHPSDFQQQIQHIASGFQESVVDVLSYKLIQAAKRKACKHVAVVGGVAANNRLRDKIKSEAVSEALSVYIPSVHLCGDNAAMIAAVGFHYLESGKTSSLSEDVYSRAF